MLLVVLHGSLIVFLKKIIFLNLNYYYLYFYIVY
jgi:hypothetical protein